MWKGRYLDFDPERNALYVIWNKIASCYKYVAISEFGNVWAFTDKPYICRDTWYNGRAMILHDNELEGDLVDFPFDWEKTLVERPVDDGRQLLLKESAVSVKGGYMHVNWSMIGSKYNYITVDKSGQVCAHVEWPIRIDCLYDSGDSIALDVIPMKHMIGWSWKDSLIKRPTKKKLLLNYAIETNNLSFATIEEMAEYLSLHGYYVYKKRDKESKNRFEILEME